MKVVICGSLKFASEMKDLKHKLEERGHAVQMPVEMDNTNYEKKSPEQGISNILSHDLIRKHYRKIVDGDAVLIVNISKNGIENYIGGNTFLEMGFAHVNHKKIFVLNPLPAGLNYYEEMAGMQPVVINGDVDLI